MGTLYKVGSRIEFMRDLEDGVCEDHPGFIYAHWGSEGIIVGEKNQFGYAVTCPAVNGDKPFRAFPGRDFLLKSRA